MTYRHFVPETRPSVWTANWNSRIIINAASRGMRNEVANTSFKALFPFITGKRAPIDNIFSSEIYAAAT